MVAITVGAGVGLERSSGWVLGSRGMVGQSAQGRAGDNVYVNAFNGNLVIQNRDEILAGPGPDNEVGRTYNSLGDLSDDNGDNWRLNVSRKVAGLTGTLNTAGSTVRRIGWDGSDTLYTYDVDKAAYVATDGAGAYDTLTLSGSVWTWTDGNSRVSESYDDANGGRITGSVDLDGDTLTFAYNTDGLVSRVTTGAGEYTDLTYSGLNLTQVVTSYKPTSSSALVTLTRVRYAYDASNRLTTVSVDLSPDDNSVADGRVYVTTYGYDAAGRVTSINQSDGSGLAMTYDAGGRVLTLTQTVSTGVTRVTSFNYGTAGQTSITDASGQVTVMKYDAAGQLKELIAPPPVAGGTGAKTSYVYNARGDVLSVTDPLGHVTSYTYDTSGNTLTESNAGGLTTRTYGAANQLLTETRTGTGLPTGGLTTRYVYDAKNHLRYTVTAEGRVTQYTYSASTGLLANVIGFTQQTYDVSGLAAGAAIAETTLAAWVAGITDKSRITRTSYAYDFRGLLTTQAVTSQSAVDGASSSTDRATTYYTYDQAGRLLSRNTAGVSGTETYVYDGLGRLIGSSDAANGVTAIAINDAFGTTVVTAADGSTRTSVFNRVGELISETRGRGANLVDLRGWPDNTSVVPSGNALVSGWAQNMNFANETQWDVTTGPDGTNVVAMHAGQADADLPGGGDYTNAFTIDGSKAYQFTFYFRKDDLTNQKVYFGLSNLVPAYVDRAINGAATTNPYFYTVDAATQQATLEAGHWYKVVGYVLPEGTGPVAAGSMGGVYDMQTGQRVASTETFRWSANRTNNQVQSRFFVYEDPAQPGLTTFFYRPEVNQVDSPLVATGPTTTYAYDKMGRLRIATDPTGVSSHILYDRAGRKVADITGDGSIVEYRYDDDGKLTSTIRYATKLTAAKLASLKDSAGNPTAVELASVRPTANSADAWEIRVYDSADRLRELIDPMRTATAYTYDAAGRLTDTRIYSTALTAAVVDAFKTTPTAAATFPGTTSRDRITRQFYDLDGRQIGGLDAEGYLSQIVYDGAGRSVETIRYATVTVLGNRASGAFTTLLGDVTATTNANDIHTWTLRDGRGQVMATISGEGQLTRYHYTAAGHLDLETRGQVLDISGYGSTPPTLAGLPAAAAGTVLDITAYTRNLYGQVLTETKTVAGGTEKTTYAYDSLRRLVGTTTVPTGGMTRGSDLRYDGLGRLIGQLGGEGRAALLALGANPTEAQLDTLYATWGVRYVYDEADRLISRIDPNGTTTAGLKTVFYYDKAGLLTHEINALGEVVAYGYDALGRRTDIADYSGRLSGTTLAGLTGGLVTTALTSAVALIADAAKDSLTHVDYNQDGTISQTIDALGAATTYTYNAFGEVAYRYDPIGAQAATTTSRTAYAYDRLGRVITQTRDATLAVSTSYQYDGFGRVISTTDPMGAVRTTAYDRSGQTVSRVDARGYTTAYTYDGRGNVVAITDQVGAQTTYAYTAFNRQITTTTPEGLTTVVKTDAYGQTLTVTDPSSRVTTYAYDLDGRLKTVSDAAGVRAQNEYDSAGRLLWSTDGRSSRTSFTYDAANRVLTRKRDDGGLNIITAYAYDGKGQTVTVTDAGRVTAFEYDLDGRQTAVVVNPAGLALRTTYAYDRAGNQLTMVEGAGSTAARTTTFTYDALGRLVSSRVGPAGLNGTTSYAYDANGNMVRRTDGAGKITRYAYDEESNLTASVDADGAVAYRNYDRTGRLLAERLYAGRLTAEALAGLVDGCSTADILAGAGTATGAQRVVNVYDTDGRVRFVIGADLRPTEYVYDASGNVIRTIAYATTIPYVSTFSYTSLVSQTTATAFATAADRTTRAVYDAANRLAYMIDATGAVTAFTRDGTDAVVKQVRFAAKYTPATTPTLATMTTWATASAQANHAGNRTDRSFYDGAGRQTYSVDAEGYTTQFVYAATGLMTSKIRHATLFAMTDATTTAQLKTTIGTTATTAAVETYTYDAAGRLTDVTKTIDVNNTVTSRTHYDLDARGQIIDETAAYGTSAASVTHRVYDAAGRIQHETRGYEPDAVGRGITLSWYYDGAGRVTHHMNTRGYTSAYTYSGSGNLLTTTTPLNSSGSAVLTREYDAFGNVVKVIDALSNEGYFYYDSQNRLIAQVDAEGYLTRTTYSIDGEVTLVQRYATRITGTLTTATPPATPGGAVAETTIIRDKLDRITSVSDAMGFTESYVLNAFGDRITVTNKLGGITSNLYDKRGLLTSETRTMNVSDAAGAVVASSVVNAFEYDARGNLVVTTEAAGLAEERVTLYAYDKLDRMILKTGAAVPTVTANFIAGATASPTESIKYDLRGNVIETVKVGSRTLFYYDLADRKVAEISAVGTYKAWTYDFGGNVISEKVYATAVALPATVLVDPPEPPAATNMRETTFGYDRNNRLVTVTVANLLSGVQGASTYATTTGPISTSYTYDEAGNLKRTTGNGGLSSYTFYDKMGRVIAEVDVAGYATFYTRDGEGNVLSEERYAVATSAGINSNPASLRNALSTTGMRRTNFTYDLNGRRLTESRVGVVAYTASGLTLTASTSNAVITYTYNGLGQVTKKAEANTDYTNYAYDGFGRQITATKSATTDYTGDTGVYNRIHNFYDGLSNVVRSMEYDVAEQNVSSRVTTFSYGAGGRLTSTTDATGFTHNYAYDLAGNLVRDSYVRTKSDGTTVSEASVYRYDLLGRVLLDAKAVEVGAAWSFGGLAYTQYRYNTFGEITGKGYNGQFQETFDYDTGGRMWRSRTGDGAVRLYVYDKNGKATLTIQSSGTSLIGDTIDTALARLTNNGASAIGSIAVTGVVATIEIYDARGQSIETREPFRQLSATTTSSTPITRKRTYNAFGEVLSETDARLAVTNYAYNTMGRLTERKLPTVSVTSENGAITSVRPTETYYYDISGRLIGTKDANGNINTRVLLAGSGHGGEEAIVLKETHADGGVVTWGVDVYGDIRKMVDAVGKTELYDYDAMGRLTKQTHQARPANSAGNPSASAVQLIDNYTYDGLGQRITHWNNQLGSSVKETTDYDGQGRVVRMQNFGADITSYAYAWSASQATGALGTFGAWTRTMTSAIYTGTVYRTATETTDYFGHLVASKDLGGRVYTLNYDVAGRLTSKTSTSVGAALQSLNYTWLNTGRLAQLTDNSGSVIADGNSANITSKYSYDVNGNRLTESHVAINYVFYAHAWNGLPNLTSFTSTLQSSTATYDALNRLSTFVETGNGTGTDTNNPANVTYEYDANGNVRRMNSVFQYFDLNTNATQDYWYKYDSMNRFTLVKGMLNGERGAGTILRGVTGADITYDAAGQRVSATRSILTMLGEPFYLTYTTEQRETYGYTADGYLANVSIAAGTMDNTGATTWGAAYVAVTDVRDAMGRLTLHTEYLANTTTQAYSRASVYDAKSNLTSDTVLTRLQDGKTQQAVTTYHYGLMNAEQTDWTGGYQGGVVTHSRTTTQTLTVAGTTIVSETDNTYEFWDSALIRLITHKPNINLSGRFTTRHDYDANGHASFVKINDGRPRTVTLITDAQGQTFSRVEASAAAANPKAQYFYLDGERIGDLSNDGPSDVDYSTSIARRNVAASTTAFQNGMTTPTGFADFDQAYDPITAASDQAKGTRVTVQEGDTLSSIALAQWGDASLWYMIADANGLNGSETLVAGRTLIVPPKVANVHNTSDTFRVYNPNDAIGNTNPTQPKPQPSQGKKGCGGVGQIIAIAIAVVVAAVVLGPASAALTNMFAGTTTATAAAASSWSLAGAVAGGAVAGAAGSIASQSFSVAVGIQDRFDWKGVGLAAISGGIGGGLGTISSLGGGGFVNGAIRGATANVLTQGVSVAVGLQDKFDWTGVAVGAVVGGVSSTVNGMLNPDNLQISPFSSEGIRNSLVSGSAAAVAGAASRSLIDGSNFGDNILRALPDVIGQTIGNAVAGGIQARATVKTGSMSQSMSEDAPYAGTVASPPAAGLNIPPPLDSGNGITNLNRTRIDGDKFSFRAEWDRDGRRYSYDFLSPDSLKYAVVDTDLGGYSVDLRDPTNVSFTKTYAELESFAEWTLVPQELTLAGATVDLALQGLPSAPRLSEAYSQGDGSVLVQGKSEFDQYWSDVGRDARSGFNAAWSSLLGNPIALISPIQASLSTSNLVVAPLVGAIGGMSRPFIPDHYDSVADRLAAETNAAHPFFLDPNHVFTQQARRDVFAQAILAGATARLPIGMTARAAEGAAPFSRLSQPGGLAATEGQRVLKFNGQLSQPTHPLFKHGPDVTDSYLQGRVSSELASANRTGMRTAFNDRAVMEDAIVETFSMRQGDISAWLASGPRAGVPRAFEANPGLGNLGRGFEITQRGGPIVPIARPMPSVNLVLIPDGAGSYLVHTAHPF